MNSKTTTPEHLVNADELLAMGRGRRELIRGKVFEMPPAGDEHNVIAGEVFFHLRAWVKPRGLGTALPNNTGFVLQRDPDTVRAPDAAFVLAARHVRTPKYHPGAPDLAVEVLSPDDRPSEMAARIHDYFAAGTTEMWVVAPKSCTVTIHRPDSEPQTLGLDDTLTSEALLPGFRLPLRDIFG